jgi:hypothetical protein
MRRRFGHLPNSLRVPFHRTELECKYGPLQIESRASHYKEGDAVMIIERPKVAYEAETLEVEREVAELPAPEPEPAPVAKAAEPPAVEPAEEPAPAQSDQELPRTAGGLPLLAWGGALSVLTGLGIRREDSPFKRGRRGVQCRSTGVMQGNRTRECAGGPDTPGRPRNTRL